MPTGVKVTASKVAGTTNSGTESGRFIIAAPTATGPTEPTLVRSLAVFAEHYGLRTPAYAAAYDAAELFFKEGGAELVVARVLGPAAQPDTGTIKARVTGVDPSDAITVKARAMGANSRLALDIGAGKVTVLIKAASGPIPVEVGEFLGAEGLLDFLTSSAYVNGIWTAETDPSDSMTVDVQVVALEGGQDDGLNATTAEYLAAGVKATDEYRGAAWSTPGFYPGVAAFAEFSQGLGGPLYITAGDRSGGLEQFDVAGAPGLPDNVLCVYPWIRVPTGNSALTRVVAPEAYVGAIRARAHLVDGFWRVPAGEASAARWATSPANYPNPTGAVWDSDTAETTGANLIVASQGQTVLSDYRAVSSTSSTIVLANEADSIATITDRLRTALAPYVFAPIDGRGHLFSQVEGTVVGVLQPIADAGGLFARLEDGDEKDPGYSVDVSASANTLENLAQNVLNVRVAVRLSPSARLINVNLIQVPLQGTV